MPQLSFWYRLVVLGVLSALALGAWFAPLFLATADPHQGLLQVHFLDVGQGDATLIITPKGHQVLIDGGPDNAVLSKLRPHLSFWDRTLEVVVGTHPDLDHIGGLVDVLAAYTVPTIITTQAEGDSPAAVAFLAAVTKEGATKHQARAGVVYQLGAGVTLRVLSPSFNPVKLNSNAGSIVALLEYGQTRFLLMADAPQGVEEYLVDKHGATLAATVLKVGHHGSDTSSSNRFLATVQPQYAVVSAGVDNRYRHPHPDVIARLARQTKADILSTQHGTVSCVSDGQTVRLTR